MIYRRGKKGIYSYRFRFAGRMIHESARTKSKTLAREAERNRRRELEERINGIKKRGLPPTFARAAHEWQLARSHRVAANTQSLARLALKHLLPMFGAKLLCDITPENVAEYQRIRLHSGAQGRTVNIEVGALRQVLRAFDMWLPFAGKVRMLRERHDVARALTPDEERALLRATAEVDSACHTASVLALNTAMRKDEIRLLRWSQIDFEGRSLTVGHSKTEAGRGRLIPLNTAAFEALIRWAGRFPKTYAEHYVFPWCENRHIDALRPMKSWRTAWRRLTRVIQCPACGTRQKPGKTCSNVECGADIRSLKNPLEGLRFHDLRVTCITKLAESQASDMTIMAIAGHVSRRMLEHYSRIRTDAKRTALDAISLGPDRAILGDVVHQNVHQVETGISKAHAKPLN
jgi:integrase